MDNVILEVLKSNLTKNSIDAVAENKPLQYSTIECLEDCLKISKAIIDEVNKYNHQQQEQQHQVFVIGITNLFVSRCMNGPSNLTLLRAGQIVSEIGLAQMQSPNRFVLEMLSNQIQQNIRNDKTLTWADQNNLCLFTWCNKMIIDDKMRRGIK